MTDATNDTNDADVQTPSEMVTMDTEASAPCGASGMDASGEEQGGDLLGSIEDTSTTDKKKNKKNRNKKNKKTSSSALVSDAAETPVATKINGEETMQETIGAAQVATEAVDGGNGEDEVVNGETAIPLSQTEPEDHTGGDVCRDGDDRRKENEVDNEEKDEERTAVADGAPEPSNEVDNEEKEEERTAVADGAPEPSQAAGNVEPPLDEHQHACHSAEVVPRRTCVVMPSPEQSPVPSPEPSINRQKTILGASAASTPISSSMDSRKAWCLDTSALSGKEKTAVIDRKIAYSKLLTMTVDDCEGIDWERREEYLSEDEFLKVFDVTREAFVKLARWRQLNLKKKVGLF